MELELTLKDCSLSKVLVRLAFDWVIELVGFCVHHNSAPVLTTGVHVWWGRDPIGCVVFHCFPSFSLAGLWKWVWWVHPEEFCRAGCVSPFFSSCWQPGALRRKTPSLKDVGTQGYRGTPATTECRAGTVETDSEVTRATEVRLEKHLAPKRNTGHYSQITLCSLPFFPDCNTFNIIAVWKAWTKFLFISRWDWCHWTRW